MYQSLYAHTLLFLLGEYFGGRWLDHEASACLTFSKQLPPTHQQHPNVLLPLHPSQCVRCCRASELWPFYMRAVVIQFREGKGCGDLSSLPPGPGRVWHTEGDPEMPDGSVIHKVLGVS